MDKNSKDDTQKTNKLLVTFLKFLNCPLPYKLYKGGGGLLRRKKIYFRRRKGPIPFRYVLLISLVLYLILTFQGIWLVERGIKPTLIEIAKLETQKIATSVINYAVERSLKDIDSNKIITVDKDANGKIVSLGFDADVYKQVEVSVVSSAQHYMKKMEEGKLHELGLTEEQLAEVDSNASGDIIYKIPLGQATGNSLLANFGPEIPVKFTAIGDVDIDLNEKIERIGINNTWIRLSLDLHAQAKVIIPFAISTEWVSTTIPIGMVFIPGEVPEYYGNGGESIPIAIPK